MDIKLRANLVHGRDCIYGQKTHEGTITSEFYYMYIYNSKTLKVGYRQDIDIFTCLRDFYEIIMLLINNIYIFPCEVH